MSSSSKRELLLFNDIVIVCEAREKKLTERSMSAAKEVIAWQLQDDRYPNSFGLVRTDSPDMMAFACDTVEDADAWIKAILETAAAERSRCTK